MNKIKLIRTHQNSPLIQQGSLKRNWMDESYNKHAYRCLPVTMANVSGWEFILQEEVRVIWSGGNSVPRIVNGDESSNCLSYKDRVIADCNKIGMIDFRLGWIFNTEPGYETWLSGPPNLFIDGAVPMNAVIPSYWWPDEVQFNWKITAIDEEVVFPKGMPFAFFSVFKNELENFDIETEDMWTNHSLMQSRQAYNDAKMRKHKDEPWTWMNGIRTGLNEKGERIGPRHEHLPKLSEPKLSES